MQFVALIYLDPTLLDAVPQEEADAMMRGCLAHADELRREGRLLESQMLAEPPAARSLRIRGGRMTVMDGPFAETKEVLGGFNLIEARDLDEAVEIAMGVPVVPHRLRGGARGAGFRRGPPPRRRAAGARLNRYPYRRSFIPRTQDCPCSRATIPTARQTRGDG
jgi:hypothetical protein